ncbi:putative damage-inducible protein DinB [Rubricella aquisinus]|uniref:Putative damage-inducible protein DinB n=1 Tax=Rubricella aquisinus TaxID=2028108 RepID=A0A840X7Q1_9RHOB|nr:DinB family protein [Rubricella aquisinus]MBB5516737.1 putative damage-inducible protein DinB [Rubricella aquisinus]
MITTEFVQTMARYNRWQNRSLIEAASTLSDQDRWRDCGAVFRSIAETLNHILWDDRVWLARLRGDAARAAEIGARHPYTDTPRDWLDFMRQRAALDDEIMVFADGLTADDLSRTVQWTRGDEEVETTVAFNLVHMVNHQTHHRGQVHALLTRFGAAPQPTDVQMLDLLGGKG